MRKLWIVFSLLLFLPFSLAKPVLNDQVIDEANVLGPETEAELRSLFQEVERNTTAQMAVVTVQNLEGETIEEYALSLAHNKLGTKEQDNGLLLLISLEDREYRIEVGYGLEGALNDAKVGRIAREHLVPYFQAEDYDQGVLKTSYAMADVILGNDIIYEENKSNIFLWIFILFLILILIIAIISASKHSGKPGSGHRIGWIGGLGGLG